MGNSWEQLGINDLGRCFHFGSMDALWKVIELLDGAALCEMVGTDDCIKLSQDTVLPLLDEYEEYWAEMYDRVY